MYVSTISSILIAFAAAGITTTSVSTTATATYFDLNTDELSYNNNQPKNIFIATSIGGSSVSIKHTLIS
jgi:hypothetical protein